MQWKVSMIVLTGLSVLCVTGCSSTRSVRADTQFRVESVEFRDSVRVESVAVQDSVTITKTITITENERGDTIRMNTVTDRTRASVRDRVKDVEVKVVEKHDTVFVQKTDSVFVSQKAQKAQKGRDSPFVSSLKWIFAIVVAIGGLIVIIKVSKILRV